MMIIVCIFIVSKVTILTVFFHIPTSLTTLLWSEASSTTKLVATCTDTKRALLLLQYQSHHSCLALTIPECLRAQLIAACHYL